MSDVGRAAPGEASLTRSFLALVVVVVALAVPAPWGHATDSANLAQCGTWHGVPSDNEGISDKYLADVTALSLSDVWAVGGTASGTIPNIGYLPLIEHWNGRQWQITPSPSVDGGSLVAVDAIAPSDAWAVGAFVFDLGGPLIEHWDGSDWSVVPAAPTTDPSHLNDVAGTSAADVWAVGFRSEPAFTKALIEHWDGTEWNVTPSPTVGDYDSELNALAVVASGDVWAAGSYEAAGGLRTQLIEHWDGSAWSVVPAPHAGSGHNYLTSLVALSSTDVWALGYRDAGGRLLTLAEHWDGTTWTIVPTPNYPVVDHLILGAGAGRNQEVWAVGASIRPGDSLRRAISMRWNGSTWQLVRAGVRPPPETELSGVDASPEGAVWAVGNLSPEGSNGRALTLVTC